MKRSLLLVCALVSAGLLTQPADARPRERQAQQEQREERQQQREERRDERRQRREAQREEPREERQERPRHDVLQPGGLRDSRGDDGHRGDGSAAAARRAQQQNGGGRVLSVEPAGDGYRVKVLKDGEVRTHHVDGE